VRREQFEQHRRFECALGQVTCVICKASDIPRGMMEHHECRIVQLGRKRRTGIGLDCIVPSKSTTHQRAKVSECLNKHVYILFVDVETNGVHLQYCDPSRMGDAVWVACARPAFIKIIGVTMTGLGGDLYVCGGRASFYDVHCYSPTVRQWRKCAPMAIGRYLHSAVAVGGALYVLGECA
jgi:hypothetical protein